MKILGIDPGSQATGFGLIEIHHNHPVYLTSGTIHIKSEKSYLKLKEIYQGISTIIQKYIPTTGAIEQTFINKNAASALKLGQARGAAMTAMAMHDLAVGEYSARQVKQAVVGYGAADKAQVTHMIKVLLNLSHTPQHDASDALAIALCHFHTQQSLLHVHGVTKTVRGRLL